MFPGPEVSPGPPVHVLDFLPVGGDHLPETFLRISESHVPRGQVVWATAGF